MYLVSVASNLLLNDLELIYEMKTADELEFVRQSEEHLRDLFG